MSAAATTAESEVVVVKLLPGSLPAYTYIPGSSTPHPIRHPSGHSYGRKNQSVKPLSPENWQENRSYLLAIDLFNHGYYWEAHEEWDRLLRASGNESVVGRFLKGLVKMAAAGVKVREHSIHGVRRHAASAGEVLAGVVAENEEERYCGLELTHLQFAADREAQLAYKERHAVGKPVRVFPFVLEPHPLPFFEGESQCFSPDTPKSLSKMTPPKQRSTSSLTGKSLACRSFQNDIPKLLKNSETRDRWVLYVGVDRVRVGDTKRELIRHCNSTGLFPQDYFIGYADEVAANDFASGEIDLNDIETIGTGMEVSE